MNPAPSQTPPPPRAVASRAHQAAHADPRASESRICRPRLPIKHSMISFGTRSTAQGSGSVYTAPGGNIPQGGGGGGRGGPGMQPGVHDADPYRRRGLFELPPAIGGDREAQLVRSDARIRSNGRKGHGNDHFPVYNRDGSVPRPDPSLERTSGKDPLDAAAMSVHSHVEPVRAASFAIQRPTTSNSASDFSTIFPSIAPIDIL